MPLLVRLAGQQVNLTTLHTDTVLYLEDGTGRQVAIRIVAEDLEKLVEFVAQGQQGSQSTEETEWENPINEVAVLPQRAQPLNDDDDTEWHETAWAKKRGNNMKVFGESDGTLSDA